jgi:hypothetical protein
LRILPRIFWRVLPRILLRILLRTLLRMLLRILVRMLLRILPEILQRIQLQELIPALSNEVTACLASTLFDMGSLYFPESCPKRAGGNIPLQRINTQIIWLLPKGFAHYSHIAHEHTLFDSTFWVSIAL